MLPCYHATSVHHHLVLASVHSASVSKAAVAQFLSVFAQYLGVQHVILNETVLLEIIHRQR